MTRNIPQLGENRNHSTQLSHTMRLSGRLAAPKELRGRLVPLVARECEGLRGTGTRSRGVIARSIPDCESERRKVFGGGTFTSTMSFPTEVAVTYCDARGNSYYERCGREVRPKLRRIRVIVASRGFTDEFFCVIVYEEIVVF